MIFTKYSLNYIAISIFYVFCFTALFFLHNKQSLKKSPFSFLSLLQQTLRHREKAASRTVLEKVGRGFLWDYTSTI